MHQFVVFLIFTFVLHCQGHNEGTESLGWDVNSRQWSDLEEQISKILPGYPNQALEMEKWHDYATKTPEAALFQKKMLERLQKSELFLNEPTMRKNLLEMALTKIKSCKQSYQTFADKSCLGRSTGQIMQLIATVENENRDQTVQRW